MRKRPHEHLDVWKKSIELVEIDYKITAKFPKEEEVYALPLQLRRSVVSISANIAEGSARQTKNDLKQFLYISRGSISEVET